MSRTRAESIGLGNLEKDKEMMSGLGGFAWLVTVACAFEPLRQIYSTFIDPDPWHQGIGGVGGVGGLTNQYSPINAYGQIMCNQTSGKMEAYCFEPGWLFGLTPFATVLLLAWIVPFVWAVWYTANQIDKVGHLEKASRNQRLTGSCYQSAFRLSDHHDSRIAGWGDPRFLGQAALRRTREWS